MASSRAANAATGQVLSTVASYDTYRWYSKRRSLLEDFFHRGLPNNKRPCSTFVLLKPTTDRHKASIGFFATAELLVTDGRVAQLSGVKVFKDSKKLISVWKPPEPLYRCKINLYHPYTQFSRNVRLSHRRIATFPTQWGGGRIVTFHYCVL